LDYAPNSPAFYLYATHAAGISIFSTFGAHLFSFSVSESWVGRSYLVPSNVCFTSVFTAYHYIVGLTRANVVLVFDKLTGSILKYFAYSPSLCPRFLFYDNDRLFMVQGGSRNDIRVFSL
jgi:hypothetical protein